MNCVSKGAVKSISVSKYTEHNCAELLAFIGRLSPQKRDSVGAFANFFFPKTEKETFKEGLLWDDSDIKKYPITISFLDIPDDIKIVNDDILNEVIACSTCNKGYKFTKHELELSKKLNVPLSRQCPFCRIGDKLNKWVSQMKQIDRVCDKCGIPFKTHYKREEAEKVLCKKCYNQEVY